MSPTIRPKQNTRPAGIRKIDSIWTKFDSGVGFSKGCAELALKKPPPLVPSILIASCEATGPIAMDCVAALTSSITGWPFSVLQRLAVGAVLRLLVRVDLERRDLARRVEVLDHALADEKNGEHQGDRQQHVESHAGQVDPEVADASARSRRQAADQGPDDDDAGRCREEVLAGEDQHLGEMAHGRLARVALPVGVGDEAHGGVERRIRTDRTEVCRVERQHDLQPLYRIDREHADDVERNRCERIGLPRRAL